MNESMNEEEWFLSWRHLAFFFNKRKAFSTCVLNYGSQKISEIEKSPNKKGY
jgi:hypothetical protein